MKNVLIHTARWSLVLLLGLICTVPVSGKEGSDSITVKRFFCERDSLLNCTIDYLMDEGYRIRSVDSDAGFICADRFIPHDRLLSVKKGERRTLNFIIRTCEGTRLMRTVKYLMRRLELGWKLERHSKLLL